MEDQLWNMGDQLTSVTVLLADTINAALDLQVMWLRNQRFVYDG